MTDRKMPWFPLYAGDWLLDERVTAMPLETQGAYVRLLCHQWREGSIPAELPQLARLLGVHLSVFQRMWGLLQVHFRDGQTPGRLMNPRLEQVRQDQESRAERYRQAGSKGGASRAKAMLERKPSDAKAVLELKPSFAPPDWVPESAWAAFLEVRKKLKAPASHYALNVIVAKLTRLRAEGHDPEAVLNESISNAWKGVFPLKDRAHVAASATPHVPAFTGYGPHAARSGD